MPIDAQERQLLEVSLHQLRSQKFPTVLHQNDVKSNDVRNVRLHSVVLSDVHSSFNAGGLTAPPRTSVSSADTATSASCTSSSATPRWHFLRDTCSSSASRDSVCELPVFRKVTPERAVAISERLHTAQLRPQQIPQPPPCVSASKARRSDFATRHTASAPIRHHINDVEYSKHFFTDAFAASTQSARNRDNQDIAEHNKTHHIIDKGLQLDASDTTALILRLKEGAAEQRVRDHERLTEKYVDRIRKRGCPQPPGRRRHRSTRPRSSV